VSLTALAGEGTVWLWLFARAAALVAVAPFGVLIRLPSLARVAFSLAVSLWLLSQVPVAVPHAPTLPLLVAGIVRGLTVGGLSGLMARLGFSLFELAGGYLDAVFGFTLVRSLSPVGAQVSLLQSLLVSLGTVLFLASGGLADLLAALALGVRALPPGAPLLLGGSALDQAVRLFLVSLTTAASVDAPLLLAVVAVNLLVGAVGRLAPQVNLIALDFPVLMGMGLVLLGISLPAWLSVAGYALDQIGLGVAGLDRALLG
jgi:flagellar biosynthetic protein FliR